MFSLGVDCDGIEILGEVGAELDLPAELGGADLGADCLRLFLAVAMDSAQKNTETIASNKTAGFSPDLFVINTGMIAAFHKTQLSVCPLLF